MEPGLKLPMLPKNSWHAVPWEQVPSSALKHRWLKTTAGPPVEAAHANTTTSILSASQFHVTVGALVNKTSNTSVIPTVVVKRRKKLDTATTQWETLREESTVKSTRLSATSWVESSKKSYPAASKDVYRFEINECRTLLSIVNEYILMITHYLGRKFTSLIL